MSATTAYADPLYTASMPRSLEPSPVQTPESPKPRSFLICGDTSWPVCYSDFTKPTNVVSDARAEMTVAFAYSGDADIALLKNYLVGGTVCLMLEDGRAITMGKPKLESFKNMDDFYGLPKNASRIGVIKMTCDSRLLRST